MHFTRSSQTVGDLSSLPKPSFFAALCSFWNPSTAALSSSLSLSMRFTCLNFRLFDHQARIVVLGCTDQWNMPQTATDTVSEEEGNQPLPDSPAGSAALARILTGLCGQFGAGALWWRSERRWPSQSCQKMYAAVERSVTLQKLLHPCLPTMTSTYQDWRGCEIFLQSV